MAKKLFTVNLDEEETLEFKQELEKRNLTFSGYMQMLISENLQFFKSMPDDPTKMTVGQVISLMTSAFQSLKEDQESVKKSKKP